MSICYLDGTWQHLKECADPTCRSVFYDRSRNPYIDRHPPLAGRGWGAPQLWTPIPGTALKGRSRPQPPAPCPGPGGANIVHPIPTDGVTPPIPTVVGYEPYDSQPFIGALYLRISASRKCRHACGAHGEHRPRVARATPRTPTGCGTDAGYTAHRRAGETPCQACREAHTAANASRQETA